MDNVSITVIDVLVVAVVGLSAMLAAWRGLVHETLSIFEWIAAGYVALRFGPSFQPLLQGSISPPWLELIVVYIATFFVVLIPLSIFSNRLADMVKKSEIGPVDRTMGFVFGVGRGLAIIGVVYIAFAALVPVADHPTALTNAQSYPLIRGTGDVLLGMLPARSEQPIPDLPATARTAPPPQPAPQAPASNTSTYSASERDDLNRLIENSTR